MNVQLNTQPAEALEWNPSGDGPIDVVNIWATIQGEAMFAGTPAVFVRLAGCNLKCPHCDTDYTSNRRHMEVEDIVHEIKMKGPQYRLVVLTGGEPFRQDIKQLIDELILNGYQIQVETNGTVVRENIDYENITIVCSPKTSQISSAMKPHIDAYKYVVAAGFVDSVDGMPLRVLGYHRKPAPPHEGFEGDVFIQPEDNQNEKINASNTSIAIWICEKFGWRLCLQVHKIIGLP